jgi:hypothetical protein
MRPHGIRLMLPSHHCSHLRQPGSWEMWRALCIRSIRNFGSFMSALGSRQAIEAQWQTVILSHKERERR